MKNVWNIKEKWSTGFHGISWRICPEKLLEKKKKFRLYNRNSVKIPGGKIQYCPRNFTNIAEINQKIHGIRRKLWWNLPKKNPDFFNRVIPRLRSCQLKYPLWSRESLLFLFLEIKFLPNIFYKINACW